MFNFSFESIQELIQSPVGVLQSPLHGILTDGVEPVEEEEFHYRNNDPVAWCNSVFKPSIAYSDWHRQLLKWFGLNSNAIYIAPRGQGKSTVCQQGVIWALLHKKASTVLYVSGTQAQADLHVESILSELEKLGVTRLENQYGNSRGYRKGFIRTSFGSVIAVGLDKGIRGMKLDSSRPDLIIIDDAETSTDTRNATFKKQQQITKTILPVGSSESRILFIQNKILKNGLVSKLQSKDPPFLQGAEFHLIPALTEFKHSVETIEGRNRVVIDGSPTWEGMSLETCQKFVDERGLEAFLNESQHEFQDSDGKFFKVKNLRTLEGELPKDLIYSRGWDFAATEGAGDYTVGVLLGYSQGIYYLVDLQRFQYSPERVEALFKSTLYEDSLLSDDVLTFIPQDPGAAGKSYAEKLVSYGDGIVSVPQTASKAIRAKTAARYCNEGNLILAIPPDLIEEVMAELEEFNVEGTQLHDDVVDALALAFHRFETYRELWSVGSKGKSTSI